MRKQQGEYPKDGRRGGEIQKQEIMSHMIRLATFVSNFQGNVLELLDERKLKAQCYYLCVL